MSVSGRGDGPHDVSGRGHHTSWTYSPVTVNAPLAGSPLDVKPDITHAWNPAHTTSPTGLAVNRS